MTAPEWEVTVEYRAHQCLSNDIESHTVECTAPDEEAAEALAEAVVRNLDGVTVLEIVHAKAVRVEDENSERIAELHAALSHSLTHGSAKCSWCKKELAGPDGFCSRMCRVESWKANGDDSAFLSEEEAEALAWGRIVRDMHQEESHHV